MKFKIWPALAIIILSAMLYFLLARPGSDDVSSLEPANNQEEVAETVPPENPVKSLTEEKRLEISAFHLSPDQKTRAERLISLFENGTVETLYGYIENLDDGRGFTAGKAGFTTADGEVYLVVQKYTEAKSDNKLAKYLPELKKLSDKGSDAVKNLKNFEKVWIESADDEEFKTAQDYLMDKYYYLPSQDYSDGLGLQLALSRAFVYDTIIQHGDGGDPDSISSLLKKTEEEVGGAPIDGVDEAKWLEAFIKTRKSTLKNPKNKETKDEWRQSTGRCDVYQQILEDKNYSLGGPIEIKTSEYKVTVP